jgi:death-on-curing protein
VQDVTELHATQLAVYGGLGLYEITGYSSAVAQLRTSCGGAFVNDGLFAMAEYLFHFVSNHPFVDGNKRTRLLHLAPIFAGRPYC